MDEDNYRSDDDILEQKSTNGVVVGESNSTTKRRKLIRQKPEADNYDLPVVSKDVPLGTTTTKHTQRSMCNCTDMRCVSDFVAWLKKKIHKMPSKLKRLNEDFNRKGGESLRSDRQMLKLYLLENLSRIILALLILFICIIGYNYASYITNDEYTENIKKDFLLSASDRYMDDILDTSLGKQINQIGVPASHYIEKSRGEDEKSTQKLCYNTQHDKQQQLFFDDSFGSTSWKARCISDCIIVDDKTTIEKLSNKNCLSYSLKVYDSFDVYNRLLTVLYKQKLLTETCYGTTYKGLCTPTTHYSCECHCSPFSSIILPSVVEDIYLWQIINVNRGSILEISYLNLLYINHTLLADITESLIIGKSGNFENLQQSDILPDGKFIAKSNQEYTNEQQQQLSSINSDVLDDDLRTLYEDPNEVTDTTNKNGIISSFYGIMDSIVSAVNNVDPVNEHKIAEIPHNKIQLQLQDITTEQKYNLLYLFLAQSIESKDGNKPICNFNALKLRAKPLYEEPSYVKNQHVKTMFDKLKRGAGENLLTFLERYIVLKQKIYDVLYQHDLPESHKMALHYMDTPQIYMDVVRPHRDPTHNFDLHNFLDFYYKSRGKLESSFWSPFFGINDANYIKDLIEVEDVFKQNKNSGTDELKKKGTHTSRINTAENEAPKDYLTVVSNIFTIATSVIDELYSSTTASLNEKNTKPGETNRINNIIKNKLLTESPAHLKQNSWIRNLLTSTLITEIQTTLNEREMYGPLVDFVSTTNLFGNSSVFLFRNTKINDNNVGSLYKMSGSLIETTKQLINKEIKNLVQLFRQYKLSTDIKRPTIHENVKPSDIKTCFCGFNFMIPTNMVFSSHHIYRDKKTRVETSGWFKPTIIDRHDKIKPAKDVSKYFYESASPDKVEPLTRDETYTIDWVKEIYSYQYLLNMMSKDWQLVLDLIEDTNINPNGPVDFPLLYLAANAGISLTSKGSHLLKAIESLNMSKTDDKEIDLKLVEFINPLTPNLFSVVEHYETQNDRVYYHKTVVKTNSFYETQCVDFCTATWGFLSEYSFKEYNKHITQEASGYGTPPFRCKKDDMKVCALEWAFSVV